MKFVKIETIGKSKGCFFYGIIEKETKKEMVITYKDTVNKRKGKPVLSLMAIKKITKKEFEKEQ